MKPVRRVNTQEETELGKRVGERIRTIRTVRSFTQEDLARRIGTQRPAVSNWENGINIPSVPTLEKLADILEVPIRALLETSDDDNSRSPGTAVGDLHDQPGLNRWVGIYDRLNSLGEEGQTILRSATHLLGRLSGIADIPQENDLFPSLTTTIHNTFDFSLDILIREDRRRTGMFLREIGISVPMECDTDRFAHINQLFVMPTGYGELISELREDRHVVILTGRGHRGKSFLGLRLLMDLCDMSYRPHFYPGTASTEIQSPENTDRLTRLLTPGQAIFLDDPFRHEKGARPLGEFSASPREAIELANATDTRLIVAVNDGILASTPGLRDAVEPWLWSVEGRYTQQHIDRMVMNYCEVYHPSVLEPITLPADNDVTPHDIERSFAVLSDNRQTIRRRATILRRESIEALIREDLDTLDDTDLAILLLAQLVPRPWNELKSLYEGLNVRGIGGEVIDADTVLTKLGTMVYLLGRGDDAQVVFHHNAYRRETRLLVSRSANAQKIAMRMISCLLKANAFCGQMAISIANELPVKARLTIADEFIKRDAGSVTRTFGEVLAYLQDLSPQQTESFNAVFLQPLGSQYAAFGTWLMDNKDELPDHITSISGWAIDEESPCRTILTTQDKSIGIVETMKSVTSIVDEEELICAAQAAIIRLEHASDDEVKELLPILAGSDDRWISLAIRRGVQDLIGHIPPEHRQSLLNAV
jgi:transcriptional regulator with XRE-family HTH domain